MIELTEEQVGRLITGSSVTISVGDPWDFTSPDGDNILLGRVAGSSISIPHLPFETMSLEVTPFEASNGAEVSRLEATARHRTADGLVERLAAGEEIAATLSYENDVLLTGLIRLSD